MAGTLLHQKSVAGTKGWAPKVAQTPSTHRRYSSSPLSFCHSAVILFLRPFDIFQSLPSRVVLRGVEKTVTRFFASLRVEESTGRGKINISSPIVTTQQEQ